MKPIIKIFISTAQEWFAIELSFLKLTVTHTFTVTKFFKGIKHLCIPRIYKF